MPTLRPVARSRIGRSPDLGPLQQPIFRADHTGQAAPRRPTLALPAPSGVEISNAVTVRPQALLHDSRGAMSLASTPDGHYLAGGSASAGGWARLCVHREPAAGG